MDDFIEMQESPRNNFTMIPNLVDDLDLDPYAFRLYVHLRRVAGERGSCWRSGETLARECHMSTGKVSQAKHRLASEGLIKIREVRGEHGIYHAITICDIWRQNSEQFAKPSPHEGLPSPHEGLPSPGETIKNPLIRTHEEDCDSGTPATTRRQSSLAKSDKLDLETPPEITTPSKTAAPDGADRASAIVTREKPPKPSRSSTEASELQPVTTEERVLFGMLDEAARAKGRRLKALRFQNPQQARDFRAAVKILNGKTKEVLEVFFRRGGDGLGNAVSYVCGAARKCQEETAPTSPPPLDFSQFIFAPTSWEEA